jgi:hypothetical protein
VSAQQPGQWVRISRTFRDGSTQDWWALEIEAGPYGPAKVERAVVATTDPQTLPDATTWYLVTNLPARSRRPTTQPRFAPASLQEVIRLYGLRMWVEQSYKQVKHTLGWSQYQVRSDKAMRRDFQLVCCAFSFCWYHASHPPSRPTEEAQESSGPEAFPPVSVSADAAGTGEKNQRGTKSATTPVLAGSPSSGARMVGAVDHGSRAIGERGQSSPYLRFSSACLISLGADRGSSSLAPSDWYCSSLFVSSQAHGSPGSSKPDSRACHVQLPTTGNSRSGLHRDGLPGALALLSATLLLSWEGALEWVAARRFLSRAAV